MFLFLVQIADTQTQKPPCVSDLCPAACTNQHICPSLLPYPWASKKLDCCLTNHCSLLFCSLLVWSAPCWWPLAWFAEGFCVAGSGLNKHFYSSLKHCFSAKTRITKAYQYHCGAVLSCSSQDGCTRIISHWGLEWLVCISRRVEEKRGLILE